MAIKPRHINRALQFAVVILATLSIGLAFSNWRQSKALDGFWVRMQTAEAQVGVLKEQQSDMHDTLQKLIEQRDESGSDH